MPRFAIISLNFMRVLILSYLHHILQKLYRLRTLKVKEQRFLQPQVNWLIFRYYVQNICVGPLNNLHHSLKFITRGSLDLAQKQNLHYVSTCAPSCWISANGTCYSRAVKDATQSNIPITFSIGSLL